MPEKGGGCNNALQQATPPTPAAVINPSPSQGRRRRVGNTKKIEKLFEPRPEGRLRTTFCDRGLRISRGAGLVDVENSRLCHFLSSLCSRRPWRHLRAEALASETLTKRSCGAWAVPAPIRSSERVGHEMQLPILRHPRSQCSLKGSGRSTRRLPPGSVRSDVRARTGRDDSEGLGPGQIGVRESAAIPPAPDSVSIDPSADSASADYS